MAESSALLVDEALPEQSMRQWALCSPFQLRFLFAAPEAMGRVLGLVYRVIAAHLVKKAGYMQSIARTGAVKLIERCRIRPYLFKAGNRD